MTEKQTLRDRLQGAVNRLRNSALPDDVERADAESVDPKAPIDTRAGSTAGAMGGMPGMPGMAEAPRPGLMQRIKSSLYRFFVPQPVMVPAQLRTPEIDLEEDKTGIPDTKLKGQMVYLLIIGFFTTALLMAALLEFDEAVRAEGDIVPSESVQIVQSRLPGSVQQIMVKLGDRVEKGQVMFEIEDEDVVANFENNQIQYHNALAAVARLEAEVAGADTITFPAGLAEDAPEVVAQAEALFASRRRNHENERQVILAEIEGSRLGLEESESEQVQAAERARIVTDQLAIIQEEHDAIKPLVDKGFEPRTALLNIRGRLKDAEEKHHAAVSSAENAKIKAGRFASDLARQTKRLETHDSTFRQQADTDLVEAQTNLAQTVARLEALEMRVQNAEVRAPVDGIVSEVHVNTVGAVVDSGAALAEVVPFEDTVTIRARVNTDDVSKVSPGQKVFITLTSYANEGRLEGVVDRVAQNSTQQENLPPYFAAIINVPEVILPETGIVPEVTSGTPVVVDMIAGRRTLLTYILQPLQTVKQDAFREK